jgi:hypothetical protein
MKSFLNLATAFSVAVIAVVSCNNSPVTPAATGTDTREPATDTAQYFLLRPMP